MTKDLKEDMVKYSPHHEERSQPAAQEQRTDGYSVPLELVGDGGVIAVEAPVVVGDQA